MAKGREEIRGKVKLREGKTGGFVIFQGGATAKKRDQNPTTPSKEN